MDFPGDGVKEVDPEQAIRDKIAQNPWSHKELLEARKISAKKNSIKESLGSASKTISTATPKQPIIEVNEAFARMQRLAGLKK